MNFEGTMICGNDEGSEVYAYANAQETSNIFKYFLDPTIPQSLPSRIVSCFHELPKEAHETFSNRSSMREAVWSSIRGVWDQCITNPSITAPDVTVEIYEDAQRQDQWRISHESCYNKYVETLLPASKLFQWEKVNAQVHNTIAYSSLVQIQHLGGGGRACLVRSGSSSDALHVFKGVDFGAFLESPIIHQHMRDWCYHEMQTISSLPQHPHIMSPPHTLVTVSKIGDNQQAFICGALYPFMKDGTLNDQIQSVEAAEARLPLKSKAAWCFQMASAIALTHLTAHNFHMDIKPSNIVLDSQKNVVVIDWEQRGAPVCTLAPEADGSWDVKEVKIDPCGGAALADSKLVYEKYCGPDRENLPYSFPKWNVFPLWRDSYPRALEAVEVFSLGRTMWMLLEQVTEGETEGLTNIVVSWSDKAKDIPDEWKEIVGRCLDPDPNERISLLGLVDFWAAVHCDGRISPVAL